MERRAAGALLTLVLMVFSGGLALAQSSAPKVTLPRKKIAVFAVDFKDPLAPAPSGGSGFDRINREIAETSGGGSNLALAVVTPPTAAPTVKFVSDDTSITKVVAAAPISDGIPLNVTGQNKGKTNVRAKGFNDKVMGSYSFGPFTKDIALHVISDDVGHTSGQGVASAQGILDAANNIWHQANVKFTPASVNAVTVHVLFIGDPIILGGGDTPSVDEDAITGAARDSGASINVYFVWAMTRNGGAKTGFRRGNNLFVSSDSSNKNRTLAHELGHILGLSGSNADYTDPARQYEIMYFDGSGGETVTPRQGDIVNPVQ